MIGDLTDLEVQATLTTTATGTSHQNLSSSYVTHVTSIYLSGNDSAATKRTVTVYKNGTATGNKLFSVDIDPNGVAADKFEIFTDPRLVLTGTQTIYFKQDSGNDINLLLSLVREQIA